MQCNAQGKTAKKSAADSRTRAPNSSPHTIHTADGSVGCQTATPNETDACSGKCRADEERARCTTTGKAQSGRTDRCGRERAAEAHNEGHKQSDARNGRSGRTNERKTTIGGG